MEVDNDHRSGRLCDLARTRFSELEKRINDRFQALQTSIDKQEKADEKRMNEHNNFRRQIEQERAEYITRRETLLMNLVISVTIVILGIVVSYLILGPR